ncbi:YheC/YheD family protein [Neobacillus sp. SM06]|uniref:YheC/YheD family endospore coat-associated protein n=1 Tax=Neobacillus sp. SM06 TaxID=3422492 RepID=UPI003D2BCF82
MSLSLTPVTIAKAKQACTERQILLSKRLLAQFGFEQDQKIKLFIGNMIQVVNLSVQDIPINEIHLPEPLIAEFSLPLQTAVKLQAKASSADNSLYLGPVVALLTDPPSSLEDEPYFRSIHSFCEELAAKTAELGGIFYIFTYKHFTANGVNGYFLHEGKWEFGKLPLPNVIYNRTHSRKLEQLRVFQAFRQQLERFAIPFFNDRFLSKWEVFEMLSLEDKLLPYLPETELFSKETFFTFLEKYPIVFLKPTHGSQGKNILKLTNEKNSFRLETTTCALSSKLSEVQSAERIFQLLQPLLEKRIYIIQQGILLATHESRSIDFRVLCHKNPDDLWQVTSIVARISGDQQFVSNIARGGEMVKPITALRLFFPKKTAKEILSLMKELAIEAADTVDRNTEGLIGELGVDIGVDSSGKLWLIEINSKPSKNFEQTKTKIRPSTKAIIQLCTKLAFEATEDKED